MGANCELIAGCLARYLDRRLQPIRRGLVALSVFEPTAGLQLVHRPSKHVRTRHVLHLLRDVRLVSIRVVRPALRVRPARSLRHHPGRRRLNINNAFGLVNLPHIKPVGHPQHCSGNRKSQRKFAMQLQAAYEIKAKDRLRTVPHRHSAASVLRHSPPIAGQQPVRGFGLQVHRRHQYATTIAIVATEVIGLIRSRK